MILASVGTAMIAALLFLILSRVLMDIIIWVQLAIAVIFMGLLAVMLFFMAFGDLTSTLKDNGATPAAMEAYRVSKEYKVNISNPSGGFSL
jgi:hypothetical protein